MKKKFVKRIIGWLCFLLVVGLPLLRRFPPTIFFVNDFQSGMKLTAIKSYKAPTKSIGIQPRRRVLEFTDGVDTYTYDYKGRLYSVNCGSAERESNWDPDSDEPFPISEAEAFLPDSIDLRALAEYAQVSSEIGFIWVDIYAPEEGIDLSLCFSEDYVFQHATIKYYETKVSPLAKAYFDFRINLYTKKYAKQYDTLWCSEPTFERISGCLTAFCSITYSIDAGEVPIQGADSVRVSSWLF